MFTSKHNPLRRALDAYDPYGFKQVCAAQALFVSICLGLINFTLAPPHFELMMVLPVIGFLVISMERGFDKRLLSMSIYCGICVAYACLITFFKAYPIFMILSIGFTIGLLFILSKKKYPLLLPMIPAIQAVTYGFLIPPLPGETFRIVQTFVNYSVVVFLTIGLMSLFPRIYFFRVFLRTLYLTIEELNEKIMNCAMHRNENNLLTLKHIMNLQDHANALSLHEHGFSAKKIALYLMDFYIFVIAVVQSVEYVTTTDLVDLVRCGRILQEAIAAHQIIDKKPNINSTNPAVQKAFRDLLHIINIWNSLCLKT